MNISQKTLYRLSLGYIYIPIFLIIFGWCKLSFSVPALLLMGISLFYIRNLDSSDIKSIHFSKNEFIILIVLILIFSYFFGWGGLAPQASDWDKHNAVLRDLTLHDWPVYFHNGNDSSMFTYYIGQYSLPAFIGKSFLSIFEFVGTSSVMGFSIYDFVFYISEVSLLIWNIIGLLILAFHLYFLVDAKVYKPLIFVLFILFGNPLVMGQILYGFIRGTFDFTSNWLDLNNFVAQYSTNFVLLRWVFQHCLCPWIVTAILLEKIKDVNSFVVLGLPLIMYSPFAFIGVVILLLTLFVKKTIRIRKIKPLFREVFSRQNLLSLFSLGVFCFCYFISYFIQEGKPEGIGFSFMPYYGAKTIFLYVLFCIFTFGIISMLLYKFYKKDVLFLSSVIFLMVLPLFKTGLYNDLVMRASIPALFVLCVYYLKLLLEKKYIVSQSYKIILILVFIISSYYPIQEMKEIYIIDNKRDLQERCDTIISLEYYADSSYKFINADDSSKNTIAMLAWNYNTFKLEDTVFKKTIGK